MNYKRIILPVFAACLISLSSPCQDLVLHSTTSLDTLSVNSMYLYKSFTKGLVTYKDGRSAASKFNVNLLVDEIQFINPTGDTLSLTDESTIERVLIGDHLFYCKKGTIEVIGNYTSVQLGVNQKMTTKAKDRIGAYGESSGTTAIVSSGSMYANDRAFNLKANENVLLERTVEYFFIKNDTGVMLPATKSNLYKFLHERDEKTLSAFITDNRINFKREEDLRKLLAFCDQQAVKQ